jgi:hypothetical protein
LLEDITDDGNNDEEPESTEQLVDSLTQTLENHGTQQLEIMDEVLEQAPEPVKQEIQSSKDRARTEIAESKAAAERAKARSRRDKSENSGGSSEGDERQGRDNHNQHPRKARIRRPPRPALEGTPKRKVTLAIITRVLKRARKRILTQQG